MLREQISDALKEAMKNKVAEEVATLRLIMAALKDRDIAARSNGNQDGISEDELLSMMQSMIKQRRESIEMYEKGGRAELAQQEAAEIAVIEKFLPKQMSEDEVTNAVKAVIAEIEASSLKDMGKVMAELKGRYAGKMDFGKASGIVKGQLV